MSHLKAERVGVKYNHEPQSSLEDQETDERTEDGLLRIYGDRLKGVYLYGSYARGDYRPGSDVDVTILLKDYQNYWSEQEKISQLASDASLKYDVTVSCIFIKELQWETAGNELPLIYNIHKEGLPA